MPKVSIHQRWTAALIDGILLFIFITVDTLCGLFIFPNSIMTLLPIFCCSGLIALSYLQFEIQSLGEYLAGIHLAKAGLRFAPLIIFWRNILNYGLFSALIVSYFWLMNGWSTDSLFDLILPLIWSAIGISILNISLFSPLHMSLTDLLSGSQLEEHGRPEPNLGVKLILFLALILFITYHLAIKSIGAGGYTPIQVHTKLNMRALQTMVETYAMDHGKYPQSLEVLEFTAKNDKNIYWKNIQNPFPLTKDAWGFTLYKVSKQGLNHAYMNEGAPAVAGIVSYQPIVSQGKINSYAIYGYNSEPKYIQEHGKVMVLNNH